MSTAAPFANTPGFISTSGSDFIGPDGQPLRLRGVCLGGWLNMENFITGYSANESLMREEVRRVIGDDRAERVLRAAAQPVLRRGRRRVPRPSPGFNLVRIAIGYKHLEDDAAPFEIKRRRLPRTSTERSSCWPSTVSTRSSTCTPCPARRTSTGTRTTRPTSRLFWQHRHFQDRVVHMWEAIAEHYRGQSVGRRLQPAERARRRVAGGGRAVLLPTRRGHPGGRPRPRRSSWTATRTRPSSTCSTEPFENAVYTLHDYVAAGLGRSPYYSAEEARAEVPAALGVRPLH